MDKHFIVLNGKRYDAVTGALLGTHSDPRSTRSKDRATHASAKSVHAPRAIVGHAHHAKPAHTAHAAQPTHHTDVRSAEKPVKKAAVPVRTRRHHQSSHLKAHKPQNAKTLMRRVVNKPSEKTKIPIRQHYPVAKTESGIEIEVPKRLAKHVDTDRLSRAQETTQSDHVGRFHAKVLTPIQPTVAQVAVAEPPVHHIEQAAAAPAPPQTPVTHTAQVAPAVVSAAPAPQPPKPKQKQSLKKAVKINVFEQALADAKSHKATPKSRRTRRLLNAGAAVASVLVLGGFVAFLSRSAIELQLASVQAGFAATMPTYAPEGFSKKSLSASSGQITISFGAPDNQNYTISQEQSNWDSQTLFDSLVSEQGNSYQVVQNNGRNIYIYGDSEAAWVDGGVLYKISGNADLSSDQLISIASGI